MKIGLVTFHTAPNHGANWQAFALQETLKSFGVETEFLQWNEDDIDATDPDPVQDAAQQVRFKKFPRLAKEQEKMRNLKAKRLQLFKDFRDSCLHVSPFYADDADIDSLYDGFFVGSDQVWNYEIIKDNTRYFLNFAKPHKRFSYAASFGLEELPEKLLPWYKEHLKDFAKISVREKNAVQLVHELTDQTATHCLDPTLLLDAAKWRSLLAQKTGQGATTPSVVYYTINPDRALFVRAQQLAEQKGMELRVASAGYIPALGDDAYTGMGILDLLVALRDAAYVVTDSFHGLCLSLTFHKPFFLGDMGLTSTRSSRLHSLLQLTGLDTDTIDTDVDWNHVDACIQNEREKSLGFVQDCLTACKDRV